MSWPTKSFSIARGGLSTPPSSPSSATHKSFPSEVPKTSTNTIIQASIYRTPVPSTWPSPPISTCSSFDSDVLFQDTLVKIQDSWACGLGRTVIEDIPAGIYDRLCDDFGERIHNFSYEPETRRIIVTELPTAMHESGKSFFANLQGLLQNWIEEAEPTAEVELNGSVTHDLYSVSGEDASTKVKEKGKEADESFLVTVGDVIPDYPTIVVEAGYSQKEADLIEAARRWLVQTDNQVLAAIILKYDRPRLDSDLADINKWKANAQVWERNR